MVSALRKNNLAKKVAPTLTEEKEAKRSLMYNYFNATTKSKPAATRAFLAQLEYLCLRKEALQ
jgi:hypothetical protein